MKTGKTTRPQTTKTLTPALKQDTTKAIGNHTPPPLDRPVTWTTDNRRP